MLFRSNLSDFLDKITFVNADLRDYESIIKYFDNIDIVIHLAAKVGGVKANSNLISDFYMENSIINQKVLDYAHAGKAKKVVSLLSTCVYPDSPYIKYPLTEDQLHNGSPHDSNYGYS